MNNFTIYKGIKERLKTVAPCFYFLGQYLKGRDNTSYIVPAIYIEMPKPLLVTFFGRLRTAKNAQVKIHLVTNAPYKNHDNNVQDNALMEHEGKLKEINDLLCGWSLRNNLQLHLTNQFIPVADNVGNFEGLKVYSIITFSTEFYCR